MGQKVSPTIFRLGISNPEISSWLSKSPTYSHLLHQDLEIRHFLENLLKLKGIFLRSCLITRSSEKLSLSLDLYFSYILSKQAKFIWARSLFKTIRKKYSRISRIRDIRNFTQSLELYDIQNKSFDSSLRRKKFLQSSQKRAKIFLKKNQKKKVKKISKNFDLDYKYRFFFFLLLKKKRQTYLSIKKKTLVLSAIKNFNKKSSSECEFVRLPFPKFKKLFGLRKIKYKFRHFYLKKSFHSTYQKKDSFTLLDLTKNLCTSLQDYTGMEEVSIKLISNQLNYLPSFKLYKRLLLKEMFLFQRNRDLKKYFFETFETLYFVTTTFGYGNARLLCKIIVFLLENVRKQLFIAKFLKKSFQVLFEKLPHRSLAIDGIKVLIKGRFNKRRRTKTIVLNEGQISLQSLNTPIDYFQSQAVTIYGSFGIKVWISKKI